MSFTGEVSLIDSIEWFASAEDLARVMQYLAQHTATGEAALARKILSINPGLSIDHEQWSYIGYKGGSEPGVLDLTFLLRHGSGPWYVLTATWNDPKAPLAEERFEGFVQRAIELLH